MNTQWEENIDLKKYSELNTNTNTDVLVIGGGICGLLCAKFLTDIGIDCIVAERSRIAQGVTGRTTAKITTQHGLIYGKIIQKYGINKAKMYYNANNIALHEYKRLCKSIDCDFEEKDSYIYSLNGKSQILNEIKIARKLGIDALYSDCPDLPFKTAAAEKFKNQAQFNPIKFIKNITENLKIYENTDVTEIKNNTAYTNKGKIQAKNFIIATHFPFINKYGMYPIKLYQERSYVIAYENAANVNGMYIDTDKNGLSLRNYNNLLLIGGGNARTGKKSTDFKTIEAFKEKYYPNASEKYRYATQDCISLDRIPYIGRYSPRLENVYTATGFNKWGMTSAMASSIILRDMITGRENENAEVFKPDRKILSGQLIINAGEFAKSLLTPSQKRCPHMGCCLNKNTAENSLDCPCHGSRFTLDGKLLNNPATGNLTD